MGIVDEQLKILDKELELINTAIRQIDDITKGIKNWAIVTWTASVGLALGSKHLTSLTWMTAAIPILFWIVDASYRRVQRSFILRNREIGDYVNSEEFRTAVSAGQALSFRLLKLRTKSDQWRNQLLGVMLFRTVALLYLGLAGLSILAWFIAT